VRKYTPEPWYEVGPLSDEEACRAGGTPPEIGVASDEPEMPPIIIAEFYNESDRDRAVACVNACTGLADPAAEIKAMKEVCEAARAVAAEIKASLSAIPNDPCVVRLNDALAALKAEGEVKSEG
jgi:hypothetical protein